MNFFKRALYSIKRRIGKSLILFLVIFILMNVMAGAVSINLATIGIEKTTKQKLGAIATIGTDQNKLNKIFTSGNADTDEDEISRIFSEMKITEDLVKRIGALDQVDYFSYTSRGWGQIEKFKDIDIDHNTGEYIESTGVHLNEDGEIEGIYVSMTGLNEPEFMEIKQDKIELVEGELLSQSQIDSGEPVILVSKPFADINKVSIGSEVVVKKEIRIYDEVNQKSDLKEVLTKTFKVIGIFDLAPSVKTQLTESIKGVNKSGSHEFAWIAREMLTRIYTTSKVLNAFSKEESEANKKYYDAEQLAMFARYESDGTNVDNPIFVLKNADDLESFKLDAKAIIVSEYLIIKATTDAYDKVAGPINSLKSLSMITLYVAILASILIISLMVLLFLRDRKEEFGIYLALGEKRSKIFMQVLIEVVLVVILAITVSMFTGNMIASRISDSIINREIQKEEENKDSSGYSFSSNDMELSMYSPNLDQSEIIDNYKVNLSLSYIGLLYAVGLGSAIVSIILPMSYVLRLKPKKILM